MYNIKCVYLNTNNLNNLNAPKNNTQFHITGSKRKDIYLIKQWSAQTNPSLFKNGRKFLSARMITVDEGFLQRSGSLRF